MIATLHSFIAASVEPGSTVRTDGFAAYLGMDGYVHQRQVQTEQPEAEHVLPRVHLVIGLLKRWMLGTLQGAIGSAYLDDYLNEFTFRFNRRRSASRGKLFYLIGATGRSVSSRFRLQNLSNHSLLCLVASNR